MCGIVGFVGLGDTSLLKQMNASQKHRGPDDSGVFIDSTWGVYLAMRRLSIVDISDGHQPMANSEGSVWIVFNGEIVNAPLLRRELEASGVIFRTDHSDTEVLIHLYERYGERMLEKLNGMFAFVIYDKSKNCLFGARDPFGIKPLYFIQSSDGFVFSSELKGLRCHSDFRQEINNQSVYHYLSFQCIPAPETIYRGVSKLAAGESFTYSVKRRKLEKRNYWRPPSGAHVLERDPWNREKLQTVIREGLVGAVRRWSLSDVPIACSLSGGVDSAILVGLMSELGNGPVQTYTVGFDDFPDLDERNLARIVSDKWGTQHHEILIDSNHLSSDIDLMVAALDEPYAGGLPSWYVFKGMAGKVKVCATGTGADELFGNYGKWRVYEDWNKGLHHALSFMRRDWRWIRDLFRYPIGSRYHIYFRDYEKKKILLTSLHNREVMASEALIERLWNDGRPASVRDAPRIIDMQIQLPDEFLHMTDRFSMAFSIEARPPFLDREFVESVLSIPSAQRFDTTDLKRCLVDTFSEYIPSALRKVNKRGFVLPIADWLRSGLRERATHLLGPSYLKSQGIFSERVFNELLVPHIKGQADNSARLWTLFMFQLWYEQQSTN